MPARVIIAGDRLFASRREHMRAVAHTGMVFQQFNLFSHLNVIDNIVLAQVKGRHIPKVQAFRRAEELLVTVGLPDKRFAYPAELSGGQQQRIGIARALAINPEVLLFDEPTSALDPSMKEEVLAVIAELAHRDKLLIIVTHELQFVREYTDRILSWTRTESTRKAQRSSCSKTRGGKKTAKFLSAYQTGCITG